VVKLNRQKFYCLWGNFKFVANYWSDAGVHNSTTIKFIKKWAKL